MKSIVFQSYVQHQNIRNAPSAAALLEEFHVCPGADSYVYTRISVDQIKHFTIGLSADVAADGVTTSAHSGASLDLINVTWDSDRSCWKIPVLIADAPLSGTLGTAYVRLIGTQEPSSTGS